MPETMISTCYHPTSSNLIAREQHQPNDDRDDSNNGVVVYDINDLDDDGNTSFISELTQPTTLGGGGKQLGDIIMSSNNASSLLTPSGEDPTKFVPPYRSNVLEQMNNFHLHQLNFTRNCDSLYGRDDCLQQLEDILEENVVAFATEEEDEEEDDDGPAFVLTVGGRASSKASQLQQKHQKHHQQQKRQLLFISGNSGTGKSSLGMELQKMVLRKNRLRQQRLQKKKQQQQKEVNTTAISSSSSTTTSTTASTTDSSSNSNNGSGYFSRSNGCSNTNAGGGKIIFAKGKFNPRETSRRGSAMETTFEEPYMAISAACSEIWDAILTTSTSTAIPPSPTSSPTTKTQEEEGLNNVVAEMIVGKLQEELSSSDIELLNYVVPNLMEKLLMINDTKTKSTKAKTTKVQEEKGAATVKPTSMTASTCGTTEESTNDTSSSSTILNNMITTTTRNWSELKDKFQYAFKRFIRVICSYYPLVVLVLDDMQWADAPTLELIKAILTDNYDNTTASSSSSTSGRLLIVGMYRSEDVHGSTGTDDCADPNAVAVGDASMLSTKDNRHSSHEHHHQQDPLIGYMKELREYCETAAGGGGGGSSSFVIHNEIKTDNLKVKEVHEMILDLITETDSDRTLELAQLVHSKTNGNPFFVMQYITSLHDMGLLRYNLGTLKWDWDTIERIRTESVVTDNVIDLIQKRMISFPKHIRDVLPLIASLGASFRMCLVELIVKCCHHHHRNCQCCSHHNRKNNGDDDNICHPVTTPLSAADIITQCTAAGLLERHVQRDSYRWVHDKIQESASSLVSRDVLNQWSYEVGRFCLTELSKEELEDSLFVTANLLNNGGYIPSSHDERMDLARINLRAGKKAFAVAAFQSAVSYLGRGVDLLSNVSNGGSAIEWNGEDDSFRTLCLDMYSSAAEATVCIGDFAKAREYSEKVLEQPTISLLQKRRVYEVVLYILNSEGKLYQGESLCLDILAKLGCHIPRRGTLFFVLKEISSLKGYVKKITSEVVSKLPVMKDESKLFSMSVLESLLDFAYKTGSQVLVLAIVKGLKMTMGHGISEYASVFFAANGLLLAGALESFQASHDCIRHAMSTLERADSRRLEARTLFIANWFCLHWTTPIETCSKQFLKGYEAGLAAGDTSNATYNSHSYTECCFFMGNSLLSIEADIEVYIRQMRELKRFNQAEHYELFYQLVLNLMGDSQHTVKLTGRASDEDKLRARLLERSDPFLEVQVGRFRLYAAIIFGEYDVAVKEFDGKPIEALSNNASASMGLAPSYFGYALACYAMIQSTSTSRKDKRKYKKLAHKLHKKISTWSSEGNPNVIHYEAVLDAEEAVLQGNWPRARTRYEMALHLTGRRGILHDQALIHERFGVHCLQRDDIETGSYHLIKSRKRYEEWGALAKVRVMNETYTDCFANDYSKDFCIRYS